MALGINQVAGISGSAVRLAAGDLVSRARRARSPDRDRQPGGASAPCVHPVLRVPRVQPGAASGGGYDSGAPARRAGGGADWADLLPDTDLGAVRQRAARGFRLRDRGVPGGGRDVVAARREVPLQRLFIRAFGRRCDTTVRSGELPSHILAIWMTQFVQDHQGVLPGTMSRGQVPGQLMRVSHVH